MLTAARKWQRWFGLNDGDRCLCVSAPYYSHGLKVTILTPLLGGGSVAFRSVRRWWTCTNGSRRCGRAGTPPGRRCTWRSSRRPARIPRAWGGSGRVSLLPAAPLGREIIGSFERTLGFPLLEHYGSSEAAQIAANTPDARKPGTVGRPWPETLSIVGEDGQPVAPGERGEIRVRGATVMRLPRRRDTQPRGAARRLFHTGDIGSLDEEGFLHLHGRLREVINRGGERSASRKSMPRCCAIRPWPKPRRSAYPSAPRPDVAAAVVLRPAMAVTGAELQRFLRDELVYFRCRGVCRSSRHCRAG